MAKIFISYRREDTESVANHLKSELEKYVGKGKVFLDSKDIPPGRDWRDVLQRSVKGSDCLLALIGPKWLNIEDSETKKRRLDNPDDFVRQEIRGALKNKKMPVVPVLVGDARMPEPKDLPDELKELASRQNFELRQRRWEDDVRALAEGLRLVSRSTLAKSRTGIKVAASLVPAALIYWLVAAPAQADLNTLNAEVTGLNAEVTGLNAEVTDLKTKLGDCVNSATLAPTGRSPTGRRARQQPGFNWKHDRSTTLNEQELARHRSVTSTPDNGISSSFQISFPFFKLGLF
jgi:hypothetical protein